MVALSSARPDCGRVGTRHLAREIQLLTPERLRLVDDARVNDDFGGAREALVDAIDHLLVALDTDGDIAAAARNAEDGMEGLHDLLEQRYGIGLIFDWDGLDDERFDSRVVRVRLAFDVITEEARDEVMGRVDERLCEELDERRFAIMSTTRIFPGARRGAEDILRTKPPLVPLSGSARSPITPPELSAKLEKQRQRLVEALQSLVEALAEHADRPRNKNRRRAYKRQERFEARVEWLHRKVLRRTGTPLVTSWAYASHELPWSGPVVLRTVFDLADGEAPEDLLEAIAQVLEGLASGDFRLASATLLDH